MFFQFQSNEIHLKFLELDVSSGYLVRGMSHISLPSKSTLAASTIPAVVYLGYLMKTKYDQSSNNSMNNSNSKSSINNNNNTSSSSSFQQAFSSQLQQKLEKVQRSRLDPIAEEKEYWTH